MSSPIGKGPTKTDGVSTLAWNCEELSARPKTPVESGSSQTGLVRDKKPASHKIPNELIYRIAADSFEQGHFRGFSENNKSLREVSRIFLHEWKKRFSAEVEREVFQTALLGTQNWGSFYRPPLRHTEWLIDHAARPFADFDEYISVALPSTPEVFYKELRDFFTRPDPNHSSGSVTDKVQALEKTYGRNEPDTAAMLKEKWKIQLHAFGATSQLNELCLVVPIKGCDIDALYESSSTYRDRLICSKKFISISSAL